MTLSSEQREAWLNHLCINCLTQPARAAGYVCEDCWRKSKQETA
jgi:hypothetical protein